MIQRLVVIGVGLIGGSLARALKTACAVGEVVGVGRDARHLAQAVELGVIDRAATLTEAVRGADMIVVAVPVGSIGGVLREIALDIADHAAVTDVGSVKGSVIEGARAALGRRFPAFVPGHPIAGTEQSGVAASTADLFRGRRVILTPAQETRLDALARVSDMWAAAGAEVLSMGADKHDDILAGTSHLPHVLAFTLIDLLVRTHGSGVFELAGTGLRDTTRVAASDPVMWRDICLSNQDAILRVLEQYQTDLGALAEAVRRGDGQWLQDLFARAKHARAGWVE
jgi:prephenate dehydrogenase